MSTYSIVASTNDATVVAEYAADYSTRPESYQSEAELEAEFIRQLINQGYELFTGRDEAALLANLRRQLEALNEITFSDEEWARFFRECLAPSGEGIVEKTRKIQVDHVQLLRRDDGSTKNIYLLDKHSIHNNRLQVAHQITQAQGAHPTRYDVTILVNGLPLVHVELKRRGVALREAFNQIQRYQRDSFWAAAGLFEYVQIFVISNGTETKYYSNTTREAHLRRLAQASGSKARQTSHSFEFTSFWADAHNKIIPDLVDFSKTFFARHTLLNILTRYCVWTSENLLLVMRPYQIAATERILSRIAVSAQYRRAGSVEAGGYIWHTTGSGKTLTSFKTAQLAAALPVVDKVLFVVDRKDLDYQTMKEYDRFEKGAADGNTSTRVLQRQLEDRDERGNPHEYRILVTTIQKLDRFIRANRQHPIYKKRVVLIFDECHRSQFGDMHQAITRHFKQYHIFGFTGTPIFAANAGSGGSPLLRTTEQAFGEKLHTYTIVDAINDQNVLPFRIDFINTFHMPEDIRDKKVYSIDREKALADPQRVRGVVGYVLEHFEQKTQRKDSYILASRTQPGEERRVFGFNSIFAAASIPLAMRYYAEFKKQIAEQKRGLKIATIFSFSPNEEEAGGLLPDEEFEMEGLDAPARDFLEAAIRDYNAAFSTNFDTSADKFQNYYKDLSLRMKNREVDLLIVVNMFLTGFDATTLNTLWVDKNLRQHGLLQAFSRTNRILNSVKTFGNIVCFRDLKEETDEAIALFGNKDAGGVVLLRTYEEYYRGYEEDGQHQPGYVERIAELTAAYPLGQPITGEEAQKDFIRLYGAILRLRNILSAFDDFAGQEILSQRDFQDYQSRYIDLYQELRKGAEADKESINDDLVFELELIRQIEVNIDYILMLVAQYSESNGKDQNILTTIDKAVQSSLELRSKKELIQRFIAQVNADTQVDADWRRFLDERREADMAAIIQEENLKPEETRRLMDNAFRDGLLKTTGTAIDRIMPPVSRFGGGREEKKQGIIEKLMRFFEKYLGLV